MKPKYNIIFSLLILYTVAFFFTGCKDLIETGAPKNQLSSEKIFLDSATANAAMVNNYARLERSFQPNFSKYLALYADDYLHNSETEYSQSLLAPANGFNQNAWTNLYATIYQCNDMLEQLPGATNLSASFRQQLQGECRFLRAFCYFCLVNTYNDVPLLLSTDVAINRSASRIGTEKIYESLLNDLVIAKTLLNNIPATQKERANTYACSALLSRVYLYQNKWALAESEASLLIGNSSYNLNDPIASTFKNTSKEIILQLWTPNGFIADATSNVPTSATTAPTFFISPGLYNAFDNTDLRKSIWIGSSNVASPTGTITYRYNNKYKNRAANTASPEYLVVLRLAEQYLIRAEARAMQNKLTGTGSAAEDLNKIRARAGLGNTTAQSQTELLTAISKERRLELFGEWADHFFDLKRTGQLNTVMSGYKPTWKATSALLPIPANEITYNKNLTQNEGY